MRLLLVAPEHGARARGNTTTVARWQRLVAARGIAVRTIAPAAADDLPSTEAIDIVHAHHAVHSGPKAAELAARLGKKLVVSVGGTDLNAPNQASRETADRVFATADLIVTAFPEQGREIERRLRRSLPIAVVRRGIEPRPILRELSSPPLVALMLGAVRPVKGHLRAIERAARLRALGLDLILEIVGPPADPDYARLVRLRLETAPFAHWSGEVAPEAIDGPIARAHLLWNDSDSEGGANAILEAWVRGRPVAARAAPGNTELLRPAPPDAAFLFQDGADGDTALLDWLRGRFGGDAATRVRAATATRDYALTNHSEAAESDDLVRAYRRVLAPGYL